MKGDDIDEEINAGRYRDASDVMRGALSTLAAKDFNEIDQGQGIELAGERQLDAFISRVGRKAAASARRRSKGG
jgi:Arc/MetJ-type ribon-helix-helix transcriptional regulator